MPSPNAGHAPPPTLREIARQAGVSHTTVSLSLRNHPSIPEATRERVQRLADRLGYRSNLLISALMSQVRMKHPSLVPEVIGFLTGGASANDWKNHSASVGYYEGARRRAQQLGMRVEAFWLGEGGAHAAETCRMLNARAIRGNLLAPFPIPVYDHDLDWPRMICVGLGYVFNRSPLHRATHNHFRGAYLAYEQAAKLGYRRIGLMLESDENSRVNYAWLGGYLAAQATMMPKRKTAAPLKPLVTDDTGDVASVRAWLKEWRPDVVIGFGPKQLETLLKLRYAVPGDIAFIALDVGQTKLAHVEKVAGIDQNLPMVGATAIDMLAGQLYHNEQGLPQRPVLSMIDGFWVNGRTA
ncbi:MAG TPA: LacI family DNA-binding transcriptional regulator [Opitutaceae bacterium]|nr:LacI family DNA-binding transcriptional regulator [Opitutaceae bacterium]